MASDRQKFRQALYKWNLLNSEQKYSLESGVGRVAIICSYFTDIYGVLHSNDVQKRKKQDIDTFSREACDISNILKIIGIESNIFFNAKASDITTVLKDHSYSDIVTIGNGNLSSLFINDANKTYDWHDVSVNSNHLKLGNFIQRQCGNFSLDILAAPLGLFAVTNFNYVYAASNNTFTPEGIFSNQNKLIKSINLNEPIYYEYIKSKFNYTGKIDTD